MTSQGLCSDEGIVVMNHGSSSGAPKSTYTFLVHYTKFFTLF